MGPCDGGFHHVGDVFRMDAAEQLPRLDDALRRAVEERQELVPPFAIDAGQPEDVNG